MGNKPQKRCLACGRLFEVDIPADAILHAAYAGNGSPKGSSFCQICTAKIEKEAQDAQIVLKPM